MFGKNLFYKEKIITILFIVTAIVGAILIFILLPINKDTKKKEGDFNEVLVATEYIGPSESIKKENIEKQKISKSIFSDLFVEDFELIKGKITAEAIEAGEIISYDKLEESESSNKNSFTFSSRIPAGKRAVTIPVLYFGNLNMLSVGDKVDVISVYYSHNAEEVNARTILAGKEIILITAGKNLKEKINENNKPDNQFALLDLMSSNISNDSSQRITITFYLNSEETENIFKNFQSGALFVSLCSSKM